MNQASVKVRAAEVLHPFLSGFHDLDGLKLTSVEEERVDGMLVGIVLRFGLRAVLIKAEPDDDTIDFRIANHSTFELDRDNDASTLQPWCSFLDKEFGWGWVLINQQGYLDGLVLSFGVIVPQLLISTVASSLKLLQVTEPPRSVAGSTQASV